MLKNYIKIAWRSLWKNKSFSLINIAGLAIGIACCLLIILFIADELSYDRYNEKANQIVRVLFRGSVNGDKINEANVMPPTGQTLKADYPEVLEATRLRQANNPLITFQGKTFQGNGFVYADSNLFKVFTIPFMIGDSRTALSQPNTIVITQKIAEKYFGKKDPIGKVLSLKTENKTFKITGVFKPIPVNSHFHFDFIASMATLPESRESSWMTSNFYTYLLLRKGYDYKELEAKLPQVVNKYMAPQLKQAMGMTISEFRKKGNDLGLFLQPLTDIHLRSDISFDFEPNSDIRYVYIFSAIAIFMLLIACINFINLSTASASKRSKEVGIRKVLGSLNKQLIRQFLIESVLLALLALFIGIVLVYLALPLFNELAGKKLTLSFTERPLMLPGILLFGLLTGVLAGSYPAFFLSSFKPISVLKGSFIGGKKSIGLRSGLVVFQFFISIILIVGTMIVYQQLNYIQNKKLGYNKDQVLVLHETWRLGKNEGVLRQQLLQDPRVLNTTISAYAPVGPTNGNNSMVYAENNPSQFVKTLKYYVDEEYIPTLGMKIVAGRNFSKEFRTDSSGVILNETAARALGWSKNAIGHKIVWFKDNQGSKSYYNVVGVVKDFHFKSLHERIAPLIMALGENSGSIFIKIKTKNVEGLVATAKEQWKKLVPEALFSYSFMDENYNATYHAEVKLTRILGIFSALTIFVACLGLFGLARFTIEQRIKEIGIRKVLGASVGIILNLITKDFLKLVFIALILASPIAYWGMNKWLQDYAYRIEIHWWTFALAGAVAIGIALLTISLLAIKAALANPVKSLRTE